jgi:hypothetical protein
MGSYSAHWTVFRDGMPVISSGKDERSDALGLELWNLLQGAKFLGLKVVSKGKIEILLSDTLSIDIEDRALVEDEMFHIFLPDSKYVEYSQGSGWCTGPSDKPWAGGTSF